MASYNKVILIGNLTRDIELKEIPSGTKVGEGSIAVNRKYKDANGEKKEEVSFVNFTAWGRKAEVMEEFLKKGDSVLLEGRLKQDRWKTENDENRSKISVVIEEFTFMPKSGGNYDGSEQEDVPGHDADTDVGSTPF
jgi:single-strand DNA-binding protein